MSGTSAPASAQPATPATPLSATPPVRTEAPKSGRAVDADQATVAASVAKHRAAQTSRQDARQARIAQFREESGGKEATSGSGEATGAKPAGEAASGNTEPANNASSPQGNPVDGTKPNPELSKQIAASLRVQAEANRAKIDFEKKSRELDGLVKFKAEFDADPFKALEKIRPGAFAEWVKNVAEGKSEQPVTKEMAEALARATAAETTVNTLQKRLDEEAEIRARAEIVDEIRKDLAGDRWELVRSLPGFEKEMLEAGIRHFEQNSYKNERGERAYDRLPWTTFAEKFEEALVDQLKPVLQTKGGRAKVMELLGIKDEPTPTPGDEPAPHDAPPAEPMKTFSNHQASSAPAARSARAETPNEARARIRKAVEAGDL